MGEKKIREGKGGKYLVSVGEEKKEKEKEDIFGQWRRKRTEKENV